MKIIHLFITCCKFILRFFQNKIGLYRPYFAQWEITYRCNLKCIFCNVYKNNSYQGRELSTEESFRLLEDLKKAGVLFINFTGGEPFLKEDFIEIAHYAKKLKFLITMNDNGTLLKQYAPLIKDCVDSVHVSLDSHIQEDYEHLRGVKDTFSKVCEGIMAAKENGIHVALNMTVTRKNFAEMEAFCEFSGKLGLDVFLTNISVIPTEFVDTSQSKDLKINLKGYAEKVKQLKQKYPFIKTSNAYLDFVGKGAFNNYRCLAMKSSVHIKPDGSFVLPCGFFPLFSFKGTLNKLKQSDSYREAAKIKSYDFCKDCTLSCFFVPTSLMDIRYLWSIFTSYFLAMLLKNKSKC